MTNRIRIEIPRWNNFSYKNSNTNREIKCWLRENKHKFTFCDQFKTKSLSKKKEFVEQEKLCWNKYMNTCFGLESSWSLENHGTVRKIDPIMLTKEEKQAVSIYRTQQFYRINIMK